MRSGKLGFLGSFSSSRLWTPLDLAVAPKILLDDQSAVTDVSGTASVWSDRSGNGWDVTAPTASARPAITTMVGGARRALQFDGGSDRLLFPSGALNIFRNTGAGWMLVIERSAVTDASDIEHPVIAFTTGSATTRFGIFHGTTISGHKNRLVTGGRRLDANGFQFAPVSAETSNEWNMVLGVADWANGKARQYRNGALVGENASFQTAGNTSDTASQIAAVGSYPAASPATFFNGQIAAVVIGSGSLPSAGEIDKLFGCYMWHFGLEANLPIGHPYKTAPPMVG